MCFSWNYVVTIEKNCLWEISTWLYYSQLKIKSVNCHLLIHTESKHTKKKQTRNNYRVGGYYGTPGNMGQSNIMGKKVFRRKRVMLTKHSVCGRVLCFVSIEVFIESGPYYTTSVPYYPHDLPDIKKSNFFQKIFLAKCESLCPKRWIFLLDHTHGNKFPPLVWKLNQLWISNKQLSLGVPY